MRIKLDKIASSTRNIPLDKEVQISPDIISQEGYIVAAKVLARKDIYNELEDVHGRMLKIQEGDYIAGVLGSRKALRGYAGYVPETINVGDILELLNLGGVIGKCNSQSESIGSAIPVEILGAVLTFPSIEERIGIPAHIGKGSIPWSESLAYSPPIIFVSGTCMHTGKTTACSEIIRELTHRGHRVAGAKLTGVSLLRDSLRMQDCGAIKSFNFTDAGLASTGDKHVVKVAKGIIQALAKWEPSVIVAELGDGIAGEYGVCEILKDAELMSFAKAHVLCASDPVASFGAKHFFKEQFNQDITVMTGPVTDNDVGINYISNHLGIPSWNARLSHKQMTDFLEKKVFESA
ncbi:MAG: hypothetical protein KDD48_02410 [Bdellovibrionales bacterium]|nr:hypothetical protein [Bdellovibrionales bacterium]